MKRVFTEFNWIERLRFGKAIYNFGELLRMSGLSVASLRRAIHRLGQKGLLINLSKGLYANSFALPSVEQVAGILYPPCYISLEFALFLHGILDQAPFVVTCVTTNKTKRFQTKLGEITYFHIKPALFYGFEFRDGLPLAWLEKAVLDYIYLQRQNGVTPVMDEWDLTSLNPERLSSLMKAYPKTVKIDLNATN